MADPVQPSNIAMAVAVSALKAQQARMQVIAENMANADSTSPAPGGDPYRRQVSVFQPKTVAGDGQGVAMTRVVPDQSDFRTEFAPGQPGADAKGYLKLPNVDPLMEALDMREAQRAYTANMNVIETARDMDQTTLSIIKKGADSRWSPRSSPPRLTPPPRTLPGPASRAPRDPRPAPTLASWSIRRSARP